MTGGPQLFGVGEIERSERHDMVDVPEVAIGPGHSLGELSLYVSPKLRRRAPKRVVPLWSSAHRFLNSAPNPLDQSRLDWVFCAPAVFPHLVALRIGFAVGGCIGPRSVTIGGNPPIGLIASALATPPLQSIGLATVGGKVI